MNAGTLLFLVQLACALFMTGLIWLIQIVHYPLFAWVGEDSFSEYEGRHTHLITFIVLPVMLMELVTALTFPIFPPREVPLVLPLAGLILLAAIWVTTIFFSIPAHRGLAETFSRSEHFKLLSTNWIRTIAWTARSCILLYVTASLIQPYCGLQSAVAGP